MAHTIHTSLKHLWEHGITDTSSTDDEGVGSIRLYGDSIYRWVKNNSGAAFVAGGACFHTYSDTIDAVTQCTDGVTADLGFMAGIAVSAIADGEYGFILVQGYYGAALVTTAGGTIAAGNALIGVNGADDLIGSSAMGTAPIYSRHAIAMEAMATASTATTIAVMVQCFM